MPQVFDYFSRLPPELRQKVWDMSIVGRVITVRPCGHGLYFLDSRLPTPLLHACQESRARALSHYTPFLRYDTYKNLGVVYISYVHDTIFLLRENSGMTLERAIACLKPDLNKIQSLVVDKEFINPQWLHTHNSSTPEQLISLLRTKLTRLREVFLLLGMPRLPRHGIENWKKVITLKDIKPFLHRPPDGYWPNCCFWLCEGEVDTSSDTRSWAVYPNLVWKLDVNKLTRLGRKMRLRGPYGLDSLRRCILIERLNEMRSEAGPFESEGLVRGLRLRDVS